MSESIYILDSKQGDVNGDGVSDNVYLIGQKNDPEDFFADNIEIIVHDAKTDKYSKIPLANGAGYNAQLFLNYFSSKQQMDILVSIDTGGSGGYIFAYLYTIRDSQSVLLFDSNSFEEKSMYEANFKDNFRVEVINVAKDIKFIIDVIQNKKIYVDAGIYDENGKLLKPMQGGVLGLGALRPLVNDYNGLYQLLAYQRIIGIYNADNLGAVQTYLKWNGNELIVDRVEVAIMPDSTRQKNSAN